MKKSLNVIIIASFYLFALSTLKAGNVTVSQHASCGCNGKVIFNTTISICTYIGPFVFAYYTLNEQTGKHGERHIIEEVEYNEIMNHPFTRTVDNLCPGRYAIGVYSLLANMNNPNVPYLVMIDGESEFTIEDLGLIGTMSMSGNKCDGSRKLSVSIENGIPPFKLKLCNSDLILHESNNRQFEFDMEEVAGELDALGITKPCFRVEDSNIPTACFKEQELTIPQSNMLIDIEKRPSIVLNCWETNPTCSMHADFIQLHPNGAFEYISQDLYDIWWYDESGNEIASGVNYVNVQTNKPYKCRVKQKSPPYCEAEKIEIIQQHEKFTIEAVPKNPCASGSGIKRGSVTFYYSSPTGLIIDKIPTTGPNTHIALLPSANGVYEINDLPPGNYCYDVYSYIPHWVGDPYGCIDTVCFTIEEVPLPTIVSRNVTQPSPCNTSEFGAATFDIIGKVGHYTIHDKDGNVLNLDPISISNSGEANETIHYKLNDLAPGQYCYTVEFVGECIEHGWYDEFCFDILPKVELKIETALDNTGKMNARIVSGNRKDYHWELEISDENGNEIDRKSGLSHKAPNQVISYPDDMQKGRRYKFTVCDNNKEEGNTCCTTQTITNGLCGWSFPIIVKKTADCYHSEIARLYEFYHIDFLPLLNSIEIPPLYTWDNIDIFFQNLGKGYINIPHIKKQSINNNCEYIELYHIASGTLEFTDHAKWQNAVRIKNLLPIVSRISDYCNAEETVTVHTSIDSTLKYILSAAEVTSASEWERGHVFFDELNKGYVNVPTFSGYDWSNSCNLVKLYNIQGALEYTNYSAWQGAVNNLSFFNDLYPGEGITIFPNPTSVGFNALGIEIDNRIYDVMREPTCFYGTNLKISIIPPTTLIPVYVATLPIYYSYVGNGMQWYVSIPWDDPNLSYGGYGPVAGTYMIDFHIENMCGDSYHIYKPWMMVGGNGY